MWTAAALEEDVGLSYITDKAKRRKVYASLGLKLVKLVDVLYYLKTEILGENVSTFGLQYI